MPGCGEIGEEGERRLERCRTSSYWIMVKEFELDPKSNGKHREVFEQDRGMIRFILWKQHCGCGVGNRLEARRN